MKAKLMLIKDERKEAKPIRSDRRYEPAAKRPHLLPCFCRFCTCWEAISQV